MASPTWMAAAGHMAAAAEDKAAAAERKRRESIGQIGKRPEKIPRKAGELYAILAQYLDNHWPGSAPPPPGSTRRAGGDPGRSGVDAARGVSSGPVGLSRILVDPALPGPTLPTGVNYGTAGLTPCPGACKVQGVANLGDLGRLVGRRLCG